jgi:carotenoid 1,2-hydratase
VCSSDLIEVAPEQALPHSKWRIARATRSDDGQPRLLRTLEDTPFYARSVVAHRLCGSDLHSVHESLDLDRFRAPLVQAMLPFRMPRTTS